jgi:hypothetical protein
MRKQEETRLEDLAAEKAQYLANQSLVEIVSTYGVLPFPLSLFYPSTEIILRRL